MTNIYQTAYDLLNNYIFGGTVVADTYPDLLCIAGSVACCAFLVTLPFLVVKWTIRAITGTFDR